MGRPRVHYAWIILLMGTWVVFGSLGLARFGYSFVLPPMQVGLGMNNAEAGLLASANLAGYLALALIGGALASRFGPRIVIALGLAVAGLGMLLTGLAGTFLAAAACRALTGLGSGASNVPVMGLMASWFGARRRGLAAGIAVTGSSIALILVGRFVPGVLAAYGSDGWRVSWYAFGAVTLALAAASYAILRNRPSDLGLCALGGNAPAIREHPAGPEPVEWGRVYRSPSVWHLGMVYTAFGFSYMIFMTFFVKRLVAEGGFSAKQAGHLFMVMGWFSLLCGLVWGAVSDRLGRRPTLVIVYLIHAAAFSLFALAATPTGFAASAILFGLSAWSIPAIMAAACGDALGPRLAPAALGFVTVFFGVGQAVGPAVAGAIADRAGTFAPAFLLAAAVAVLGAGGSALIHSAHAAGGRTPVPPDP